MTIRKALLLAAAMILFSLAAVALDKAGWIGEETAPRALQVSAGLLVVYFGNLMPKTLEPLSARCDPSRVQRLQRFSGWTLVLAGLGYSLAALVAPLDSSAVIGMVILGTGVVLVMVRLGLTVWRRPRSQPPAEPS